MVAETRVIDEVAEALLPDFSLPDVRMAVHPRAQPGFGIIQVERQDLPYPDEGSDFPDRRLPAFRLAEVVAGRKQMGGVQAQAEPLGFLTRS